jgi:hypothetical protein
MDVANCFFVPGLTDNHVRQIIFMRGNLMEHEKKHTGRTLFRDLFG